LGVLPEFTHENLVLFAILSETFLCFLGTLASVADDHSWDHVSPRVAVERVLVCAATARLKNRISRIVYLSGTLNRSCMLLEGCFGFLLEKGVDTFVQILARHIVVDYAESIDENSTFIAIVDIISDFGEL